MINTQRCNRGLSWMGAVAVVSLLAASCVPTSRDGEFTPRYQTTPGPYAELDLRRDDGAQVGMADPEVLRFGNRWYLYGTTSATGFEAWSSIDLINWQYEGMIWRPTAGTWNDRGRYWAPHVIRDNDGSFLLYYTADEVLGVARSDSPTGPFVDLLPHPLIGGGFGGIGDGIRGRTGNFVVDRLLNVDDAAIDAASVELDDGTRELYFSASKGTGLASTIFAVDLVNDTNIAGTPTQVLPVNIVSFEGFVREGPIVERRGDQYVLTYSGSGYVSTCYALGQAVADSPTGPFRRVGGFPFLHDDTSIGFFGPGHHSYTTGPDGTKVIFFHTRDTFDNGPERHVRWAKIAFDSDGRLKMLDPPGRVGTGPTSCWPLPSAAE